MHYGTLKGTLMRSRIVVAAIALSVASSVVHAADERNPEQRAPNEPSTHPQVMRAQTTGEGSLARGNAPTTRDAAGSQGARSPGWGDMRGAGASPNFIRDGLVYSEGNRAFHRVGTP
jgi:hypothetical protein